MINEPPKWHIGRSQSDINTFISRLTGRKEFRKQEQLYLSLQSPASAGLRVSERLIELFFNIKRIYDFHLNFIINGHLDNKINLSN